MDDRLFDDDNRPYVPPKPRIENEKVRNLVHWIFEIALTLALSALTAITFFQSVTMQESAMEPTLSVGDKFFMNRLSYRISDPKRGDIIVYRTNAGDDAALHIHRVIALPGETIQIVDGRVLINGSTLKETGDYPAISNPGMAATALTLDKDEYFVLGDNRNNSEDSRYADIGIVQKKYISGKVWFTVSPVKKFGFLRG